MDTTRGKDTRGMWTGGEAYEQYVGRWSRRVASRFLDWLGPRDGLAWIDVGCGTGALAQSVLQRLAPAAVRGLDRSRAFVRRAMAETLDPRATFAVADAMRIPLAASSSDAAISGLVLNFVPKPEEALAEMRRVVRRGGTVAAYVWDYAEKMEFMRYFWDAAATLDPRAAELDEGPRFPICQPGNLGDYFARAGLSAVEVRAIEIPTVFADFDDYWNPFLGGQGPAPAYTMSLGEHMRAELRERVRRALPIQAGGSIPLAARAWAARGVNP